MALGSVIVLPWHLLMIAAEGSRFLDVYFGAQVLERVGRPLEGNAAPPQYYVQELREAFGVWVYLLPFAIAQGVLQATRGDRVSRLLSILIGIVGVLYAVIETKLTWYMAPAVPALAILVAHYVITAVGRREPALLAGLGIASFAAALHLGGWAGLVAAVLILFSLRDRRPSFRRVVPAASMLLILPFFVVTAIDLSSHEGGADEPASMVRLLRHVTSGDTIAPPVLYVYRVDEPSAVFYSRRPVRVIETEAELLQVVERDKELVLIARPNRLGGILYRFRVERIHQEDNLVALRVWPRG